MKNLLKQYGDLDIDGEMIKLKSIRSKLLKNFLIVIISTITILDILTILCLKGYYYKSTQNSLINELESSINFYQKYFSNKKLMENIYDNADVLWNAKEEQIEVLDSNGNLLMDSYGIRDNKLLSTPDIIKAKNGEIGVWSGYIDSYNEKVMVISKGVNSKIDENEMIGIIRIIFSLQEVHKVLDSFAILILFVSFIVIVLGIIMSLIVAMDIVNPIKKITRVAKEMADGNLEIRSNFTDNIEIAQLSNTLNYMGSEIEKREKLKNEFISSVSHELRTPLNIFYSTVQLLDFKSSDMSVNFREIYEKHKQCLNLNCKRMLRLIDNIVDITKIDVGFTKPKFVNCDIVRVIEDITLSVVNYAENKNINIVFDTEIEEHIIKCDSSMIERAMLNLLSNAIKFTKENGNIVVNLYKDEQWVHIIVKDDGIGIPIGIQGMIFERFVQGDKSLTRLNEGSGIGLSIVKSIVELNNGEIYLDSDGENGTEFEILLPNEKLEGDKYEYNYEIDIDKIELEFSDIYELYS